MNIVDVGTSFVNGFDRMVLAYFLVLNSTYLVLSGVAAVDFFRYFRRLPFAGHEDVFANPLTPGVSIIVAAFNEEAGVVDNVRAMLGQRYPLFEVIVVDDGSSDRTFEVLRDAFELQQVRLPEFQEIPTIGEMKSRWESASGEPLVVIRKVNAGRRADATNAGLNAARHPLVCLADADSILEPDALLRVVKPFVDDPRVVAGGGVIRPANGMIVSRGQVTSMGFPKTWMARIQIIEYLRAFLLGRTAWSALGGLFIISGAFGVFRRDVVMEVGGQDTDVLGEDAELVAKIHHHYRAQGRKDYKVTFVSEPVCWTEVPEKVAVLRRQRKRWAQGLVEVLWTHRRMMLNPRYGMLGMVVLPYHLIFEVLGPVIELSGLLAVAVAWPLGLMNWHAAALFMAVSIGYGIVLSMVALTIEEFSFHRLRSLKDIVRAMAACVLENIGYRQVHAWWRLVGLIKFLGKMESGWGTMTRAGFDHTDTSPAVLAALPTKSRRPLSDEAKTPEHLRIS